MILWKNNPRIKVGLGILLAAVLLFSLTTEGNGFWNALARRMGAANQDAVADDWPLNLHMIPVGNADAMLIEYGDTFLLVDGGNYSDTAKISAYLHRRGVTRLAGLVMTHPDADHIGAFPDILMQYPVDFFYTNGATAAGADYLALEAALAAAGTPRKVLRAGEVLQFDQLQIEVLSPVQLPENSNEGSLVLRLRFGAFSALLTGDAGVATEKALLERGAQLGANLLKVSHHGSKTASSQAFLAAVQPQIAFISADPSVYGLPDPEVTFALHQLESETFLTHDAGTLILSTEGEKSMQVSTKEGELFYEIINR